MRDYAITSMNLFNNNYFNYHNFCFFLTYLHKYFVGLHTYTRIYKRTHKSTNRSVSKNDKLNIIYKHANTKIFMNIIYYCIGRNEKGLCRGTINDK